MLHIYVKSGIRTSAFVVDCDDVWDQEGRRVAYSEQHTVSVVELFWWEYLRAERNRFIHFHASDQFLHCFSCAKYFKRMPQPCLQTECS